MLTVSKSAPSNIYQCHRHLESCLWKTLKEHLSTKFVAVNSYLLWKYKLVPPTAMQDKNVVDKID